ncbi:MAG: 23S rRNA (guanosine(2251)-2'-O)-methyltransferase RlmB [Nitrospirae bacterium]|nr:23S rRNA (guanosine(2251)-2'-O)-methyltransferase RlmB [Nitrospirota bacterium]
MFEALRAQRKIKAIYIHAGRHKDVERLRNEAEIRGIPVKLMNRAFFDSRFPKGNQGVAVEVSERGYVGFDELMDVPIEKNEKAFFLILDGIEDPRNLGAILRSSEASGVHGVIIEKHRSASLSPETVKASAGASEYVAVSMVSNIKNAIEEMKKQGIFVLGAEGGSNLTPYDIDLTVPLCLVIGSEARGLRMTVKARCDKIVSLPMRGKIDSLNVSVAGGILLYEILRQRLRKT